MAAPNPEDELQRLRGLVSRGLQRLLVLSGAEPYFREAAVELAREAIPADADVRVVDGSEETDGSELQDLRGGTLFGSGSWLVVRRGKTWLEEHRGELLDLLPGMAPGCGLVLEVQRLDGRTKLARALAAAGAVFDFRTLYDTPYDRTRSPLEAELVGWVTGRARGMGVPVTPEAAYLVITHVGKAPGAIVAELERLRHAVGESGLERPLGPEEIRKRLSWTADSTPFELAEALLAGDRRRATRSLHAMFAHGAAGRDGKSVETSGIFPFATSWLFTSIGQVYEGRRLMDRGVPMREIGATVGVRNFPERFYRQVRDNDLQRLRRGLLALLQCQRDLRFRGEDPQLLLERFLGVWFGTAPLALSRGDRL